MDVRFFMLLVCFFLSGFAALLYQTAWTRELSFVFGTSELAVAAVLAAYMGGLALGAAAAARIATRLRRPVLVYGALELAIAVCALLVPWQIRGLNTIYVAWLGGGADLSAASTATTLFQLGAAFAVLLPPTAFMGATLPLLARHAVRREEQIGPRVGVLYTVNTVGAIAGTMVAAFLLMPELGLRRTVWLGAALNAVVFGLAAWLARSAPAPAGPPEARPAATPDGAFWILPAMAVSGSVSFAYEVAWTRLLGHLLGASLHAFATMLASFLLGIALGSAVASRLATTRARASVGFAVAQLGIAAAGYGALALADQLPALALWLGAGPAAPLPSAGVAVAALLPITFCIGATFPFAVRVLAHHPAQAASATARVYAWNTVGAIAGALGAGFVLLPSLGFAGTVTLAVAASLMLAALAALVSAPRRFVLAGLAAAGALGLALLPVGTPWKLLRWSSLTHHGKTGEVVYAAVGRTTDVMLTHWTGRYMVSTNGLPEASINERGMIPYINVAQWLCALPAVLRPEAKSLLVVGLGGGVALELVPGSFESIDVIELEPEVLRANEKVSAARELDPLADPRVRVHLGDARGTLQLTERRFDAIVSQPSHPWTAGASHLYTREFFELARSRLSADGVFVQWIGARFVDEALVRTLLASLRAVFPHVQLYRPQVHGLLFAASEAPLDPLSGAARALATMPEDLARVGIHRVEDFAATWTLDAAGVDALAEGTPLNSDDHNRLAARAARLGEQSLDRSDAGALFDPHDPLLRTPGIDRAAVIRRLTGLSQGNRARALAMASEGAAREKGLGWLELAGGRLVRAGHHFDRALELAPDDPDALAGWIASYQRELTRVRDGAATSEHPLPPSLAALVSAWHHAHQRQWQAMARLDPALARIAPGEALYEAATRQRIAWRLGIGTPELAAEAEALAAVLLVRRWQPEDALLHSRAALRAGHPAVARGTLFRISDVMSPNPRMRGLAERAIEVARQLPPGEASNVRQVLALRAGFARQQRPR